MNKSLYVIFILSILLSSCEPSVRKTQLTLDLAPVVENVMAGKDTTSKLTVLRDGEIPPAGYPNLVKTDTITVLGRKYYIVLAEYPDPVYNRFAIIDTSYNVLLVDKSLNGNISESRFETADINYIKLEENFISKEVLDLKRVSFYEVDDKGKAGLVFRTFTELKEPDALYKQELTLIGPEEIHTKIYGTRKGISKLNEVEDTFRFDTGIRKYMSQDYTFDSFVFSEVRNYKSQSSKPEIVSRDSYLKQLGIDVPETTTEHKLGSFSMPLSSEWNEVKDIKITVVLKKPMLGTKYINNHYGAEISVINIPANDSAENFINYKLENVSAGNYRVRFSDKISAGKYFYQFFEYSCGTEKFLLILQTLKSTYDNYKSDYQNLINSFSMDC
jgi:type VI protein secretion system component Hcp